MAAKSFMSARKTVVFTTSAMEPPAASTMALPFVSDCFVCAETSSGMTPVAGSMGSWPETKTREPALVACE